MPISVDIYSLSLGSSILLLLIRGDLVGEFKCFTQGSVELVPSSYKEAMKSGELKAMNKELESVSNGKMLKQFDMKIAFLYGLLKKEVGILAETGSLSPETDIS